MDWCLIAMGWTDPMMWLAALEVALGLGFVIFVHELGHFAVAKMCGVKCEKFMIGFDIAGIKIFSFRRGETLYGLGILPLGGYVKMLGQEDNPAALRKEIERAKQGEPSPEGNANSEEESAETKLYNPRSYLAKSVPQRMAIISAGVIMNMIFAFIFAVIAYSIGVKDVPSVVGGVVAGGAAWQAGVLPDDTVKEVAGRKVHNFTQMTQEIVNGNMQGIPLTIERPGVHEPLEITVKPQALGGKPTVGVTSSFDLRFNKEKNLPLALPNSAASQAQPSFQPGDRMLKFNGESIERYGQLQNFLAGHADKPLEVTVEHANGAGQENVKVPTAAMKQFGFAIEMGPIAAIEANSPAAKAGIQPGDMLKLVDGKPIADPLRLPWQFHQMAGTAVKLGLEREGKSIELQVKLAATTRYSGPDLPDSPVALTELGAAYYVLNTVTSVEAGGPAAAAGVQPGDRLVKVKILPPSADELKELRKKFNDPELDQGEFSLDFGDKDRSWPCFMLLVQNTLPGSTVELTWQRDKKDMTKAVALAAAEDWFNPERGWVFEPKQEMQQAQNFSDAVRMGGHETIDAALLVYRSLHSVGTGKISPRMVAGPWGILKVAMMFARQGLGKFLAFLTLLSANLAVLNFLPIPVLDGGHMVLLLYEGVRGKPADERVQEILTYIGLALLLALMVWAFGLDFSFFSRPGAH